MIRSRGRCAIFGSTTTGPIRSVSVVSTGSVQIHPQQPSGSRLPMMAWLVGYNVVDEKPGHREAYFAECVRRWAEQIGIAWGVRAP